MSTSRSALGESTRFSNFEVTVVAFEFSDSYITKYQSTKYPPIGAKFAWIHIKVQNLGNTAERAPKPFEFKLIYQDDKIHGEGGSREGHPDYTSEFLTGEEVYPGIVHEGWLRFTVPSAAKRIDVEVLFEPRGSTENHLWYISPEPGS